MDDARTEKPSSIMSRMVSTYLIGTISLVLVVVCWTWSGFLVSVDYPKFHTFLTLS